MAIDAFQPRGAFEIVPNSSADLAQVAHGFRVEGAGAVKFKDQAGNDHTWTFPAGGECKVSAVRVYGSPDTTATGIAGYII